MRRIIIACLFALTLAGCSREQEYYVPCRLAIPLYGNFTSDSESLYKDCEYVRIGRGTYILAKKNKGKRIPIDAYCINEFKDGYELCGR